ncbi:MAG TPA: transglutaminase-like domain-containing protein, partial [Roseiflexaceae bacterium]|nr:transglutaminase-like domain-containing protein [Roseiflexaceae bacterium]
IGDLAQVVAGDRPTVFARAEALEAYLRNLPYSYQVEPIPQRGDAVEQFLFEMRSGYCTYYASAMVVMARSLGIPARMAVGYATGEYDAVEGVYRIREADAHAWPELYLGDRWVVFEPTPIRPLPDRTFGGTAVPALTPVELPAPQRSMPDWLIPVGIVLLAIPAVVLLVLWMRRERLGPVAQAQRDLERIGAQLGIRWPVGATLHEFGLLLAQVLGADANRPIERLIRTISDERYGRHMLDADRLAQITGDLMQIRDAVRADASNRRRRA